MQKYKLLRKTNELFLDYIKDVDINHKYLWNPEQPYYLIIDSMIMKFEIIHTKINKASDILSVISRYNASDKTKYNELTAKRYVPDASFYKSVDDFYHYLSCISDTLPIALGSSLKKKINNNLLVNKIPKKHSLLSLICLENKVLTSFLYTCFYTIERKPDVGYIDNYEVYTRCYPDSLTKHLISDVSLIGLDTSKQPTIFLNTARGMDQLKLKNGRAVANIPIDANEVTVQGVIKYPKYDYEFDIPFFKKIKMFNSDALKN